MENLIRQKIKDAPYYPEVIFNYETGICELYGESYMEESVKFYKPLLEWMREFTRKQKSKLILNFKLTYFNSSSSRFLLDMLDIMRNHKENGGNIEVNWYYDQDDPDMEEEVDDFILESGVQINKHNF